MKKVISITLMLALMLATICIIPTSTSAATYPLATPRISNVIAGHNCNNIYWNKVRGAVKYRVFMQEKGNWKRIADTTATSFSHKVNGNKDQTYKYTVRCISADGKRFTSDYYRYGFIFTHRKAITINPYKAKKVGGKSYLVLSWQPAYSTTSPKAKYNVYIKDKARNKWVTLATLSATTTTCSISSDLLRKYKFRYEHKEPAVMDYASQLTVRGFGSNGEPLTDFNDKYYVLIYAFDQALKAVR